MTAELIAPDLSALSDAELAGVYASADEAGQAAVLAECKRRDDREAQRRRARERREPITSEWEQAAYAQYLMAERETNGYLLSRAGLAAGIDPWPALWTGPETRAMKYASEELREFWWHQRRITVCQYREQVRDAHRIDQEWREMNAPEAVEAAGPATSQQDTKEAPNAPQAASVAVTTPTEDESMGAISYAARSAARAQRQRSAASTPTRPVPGSPAAIRAQWSAGWRARTTPRAVSATPVQTRPAPPVPPRPVMPRAGAEVATVQPTAVMPARPAGPKPIDGALLWILVRKYLGHYVAFRSEAQATLVTGWVFHAMARDRDSNGIGQLIWRASPRLLVTSKERGSGKSTLLDLIVILTGSRRGKVPKITPARIAQVLGKHFETVVLDEAKTILGSGSKSLELQGCMLAGYTRRTSYEISGQSVSLFGALAYAGKDEFITDTRGSQVGDLLDRSLTVRLDPPARPKPEVAERAEDDGDLLCRALVAWTDANRAALKRAARDLADEDQEAAEAGNLRSAQISRPLRACARVVAPGAEADMLAALSELISGTAGTEADDLMAQLQERAAGWGEDVLDAEAPGRLVTSADDGEAEWDEEG